MTDEDLEKIRARSALALKREHVDTRKFADIVASLEDVPTLLAEVDAQRGQLDLAEAVIERAGEADVALAARLGTLEEIARAVVSGEIGEQGYNLAGYCRCNPDLVEPDEGSEEYMGRWIHKPDCLITKARKLLGEERSA